MWSRKRIPVETSYLPATFDGERDPNFGFRGLAMQFRFPHAFTSRRSLSFSTTSRRAPIRVRVCSSDPTVRRTQPSHPGIGIPVAHQNSPRAQSLNEFRVGGTDAHEHKVGAARPVVQDREF